MKNITIDDTEIQTFDYRGERRIKRFNLFIKGLTSILVGLVVGGVLGLIVRNLIY